MRCCTAVKLIKFCSIALIAFSTAARVNTADVCSPTTVALRSCGTAVPNAVQQLTIRSSVPASCFTSFFLKTMQHTQAFLKVYGADEGGTLTNFQFCFVVDGNYL